VKEIAAPSALLGAGSARERDLTTEYRYDSAGRVSRRIDAGGQSTWYVYDAAGEINYTINAEGEVSQTFYDANGQVVQTRSYATRLTAGVLAASAMRWVAWCRRRAIATPAAMPCMTWTGGCVTACRR